ncbi:MAG: hypothetical protein PHQ80_03900 [Candidatus ainarchaeum sp.]|nr:hypothetical protein [Candidatus ainarchaeum sp.]
MSYPNLPVYDLVYNMKPEKKKIEEPIEVKIEKRIVYNSKFLFFFEPSNPVQNETFSIELKITNMDKKRTLSIPLLHVDCGSHDRTFSDWLIPFKKGLRNIPPRGSITLVTKEFKTPTYGVHNIHVIIYKEPDPNRSRANLTYVLNDKPIDWLGNPSNACWADTFWVDGYFEKNQMEMNYLLLGLTFISIASIFIGMVTYILQQVPLLMENPYYKSMSGGWLADYLLARDDSERVAALHELFDVINGCGASRMMNASINLTACNPSTP